MKNFRYQRKTIIVVRKRIINLIIKNSTKREEKFTIFINLINFFFFFSNHYEWTIIPLWNPRVAEQPFRKCWDVLRYSTNKVYTKTTYPREWRNSRESWRRNGETIDISGNNEKREREREGGGKCPGSSYVAESDGSFRESFISRKFMIQVTWGRTRGGGRRREEEWLAKLYGRNHGRRERGQVQVARSSSSATHGEDL